MRASELRIGNLISYAGQHVIILGIHRSSEFMVPVHYIELGYYTDSIGFQRKETDEEVRPIPLTEEWLIKFGFNKTDGDTYEKDLHPTWGKIEISIQDISFSISRYDSDSDVPGDALQHVHRLQNLIFALTGEELIIQT